MPELPEVHTTVTGLQSVLPHLTITKVWTDYKSDFHTGKDNIKNPKYFSWFKKEIIGQKVKNVTRRAKNILINLENGKTILIHMKMTGHLLYGHYEKKGNVWTATEKGSLRDDPFNKWIHFVLTLSNKKHVALSDMRKFAKVTLLPSSVLHESTDTKHLGPEPLEKSFTFDVFKKQLLKRPNGKIKQVLMDQSLISGIGNIYSDEILWKTGIHPLEQPKNISETLLKKMFTATKDILKKGIDFGGDSMSDYRNIYGERGAFQHKHNAYRKTGEQCAKKNCKGIIQRIVVGGRSAHFCSVHQKLIHERR